MFTPINKDGKTEDDKIEGVETTPQSRKRAAERVETTPRGKKRYKRSKLSQEYIPNSESDDDKAPSDAPRTESGKVQEPVAMTPTVSKPVTMPSESITNTRGASDKLGEASKNTEVPENLDAEGSNIGTEGSAKAPTANQTISAISWDEAAVAQARSDAELALQMQMDLDADPRDRFLLSPERGEISSGSRASEDAELFGDEESFLMIGVDLDPLSSKRATRSGKDDHYGGAVRRSSRLDSQQNKRSSQRQMRISTPERGESSKGKQRHFRPGLEFFARVTRGDKVTEIPLPMVSFNEDPAMLLGYAEWKEREPAGTNLTYEAFCEVKKFTATRD